MTAPAPTPLVLRIFAREDGGLVEELPVPLASEAVRALVPSAANDAAFREIHAVEHATAEKLVGAAIAAFTEPVDYFLEPLVPVRDE